MILCWAAFTAILGCMWPTGRRLDTPALIEFSEVIWAWDFLWTVF